MLNKQAMSAFELRFGCALQHSIFSARYQNPSNRSINLSRIFSAMDFEELQVNYHFFSSVSPCDTLLTCKAMVMTDAIQASFRIHLELGIQLCGIRLCKIKQDISSQISNNNFSRNQNQHYSHERVMLYFDRPFCKFPRISFCLELLSVLKPH